MILTSMCNGDWFAAKSHIKKAAALIFTKIPPVKQIRCGEKLNAAEDSILTTHAHADKQHGNTATLLNKVDIGA